jgi:hypothetical protein
MLMPARHFCTLFDRNYLFKGAVMLRSLVQNCAGCSIHVLCMDQTTSTLLRSLDIPGVRTIALADVESVEVLEAKRDRSIAEYCWTLSSVLLWQVMQNDSSIDLLTYLDADLMFFSDVEPIFAEMGAASILAIEHRYPPERRQFEIYGRFNVQWVSFRRDPAGLACLHRWRSQCLDWCFARIEGEKHGDQKYLDAWPRDFGASFHSLCHVGAGLAPWNYSNYCIRQRGEEVLVDESILIFYHFHQFQILEGGGFNYFSTEYVEGVPPPEMIYQRYWHALQSTIADVRQIDPTFCAGVKSASAIKLRQMASRLLPTRIKGALKRIGLRTW